MARDTSFDYTAHAVAKDGSRTRWSQIGVAFLNEKRVEGGEPTQSVTLKLNPGISINCSECDIVLLPFKAKADA
jgi:hypothetical protein